MRASICVLFSVFLVASCGTSPELKEHEERMTALWESHVPGIKRIAVDIRVRPQDLEIVNLENLTILAEDAFKSVGIEVQGIKTMIESPIQGDAVFYFNVLAGKEFYTPMGSLMVNNKEAENKWQPARQYITGLFPYKENKDEIYSIYRDFVLEYAKYFAEAILQAQSEKHSF